MNDGREKMGPVSGSEIGTIPEEYNSIFSKFENRLELDHPKAAAQHEGAGGCSDCAEGARVERKSLFSQLH